MASGSDGFSSCIELPDVYFLILTDSYGDSWNGGSLTVGGVEYTAAGFGETFAPNGDCPNVVYSAGSYAMKILLQSLIVMETF